METRREQTSKKGSRLGSLRLVGGGAWRADYVEGSETTVYIRNIYATAVCRCRRQRKQEEGEKSSALLVRGLSRSIGGRSVLEPYDLRHYTR